MDNPHRHHPGRSIDTISGRRLERLRGVLERRQTDLTLIVENVWDPHNVGAILRSADAVGIMTVHLLYTVEQPPNFRQVGKLSSASARQWLELVVHDDTGRCFASLREQGFRIYASHLTPGAATLYELEATGKTAFVVGNEHRGVSPEACALADAIYFIPMLGMVESLNVSVATAVTLYEACRQRLAAGRYAAPSLDAPSLDALLRDWARR